MGAWGKMRSLLLSDEELGKKDDDHKPTTAPHRPQQWSPSRPSPRRTIKRLLIALLLGIIVYVFVKNIPSDVPIRDRRRPHYEHNEEMRPFPPPRPIVRRPPKPTPKPKPMTEAAAPVAHPSSKPGNGPDTELPSGTPYNGPIRFPDLAASLNAISNTGGSYETNKNILFAASSLKSVASLLPLACRMGSELRSYVHFAVMSRSEIEIKELLAINGIDDSCHLIIHDARPEYASISSESRLELGVNRALYHINAYMHPQVIIIDGSSTEEAYFLSGMTTQARKLEVSAIHLPENASKQLSWLTKLDSSSLKAWHKIHVDILIHASAGASGSLIRLLKSLTAADFTGCSVPHLTIELPSTVDLSTARFLERFQWPPPSILNPSGVRQLSLRHRIARQSLNEEESAIRFLESFWPVNAENSHVLVLSPQAELSPQFFHYVKYSILEYKYSTAAVMQQWDARLFGVSLDLPSVHINASQRFTPPMRKKSVSNEGLDVRKPTPFLWQAPNSNAVLYFGQKWVELHGFVSRMVDHQHKVRSPSGVLSEKKVSKRYPAWLEHALKLCRARGYWLLYPSALMASNLATIHNELYKAPEEYKTDFSKTAEGETEVRLDSGPLLDSLPEGGTLPPFDDLPLLTWDGKLVDLPDFDKSAASYAADFKQTVGGCENLKGDDLSMKPSAADLFCVKES